MFVGLAMLIGGCAEPGVNAQLPPLVEDKKPVSQDYVGLSESQARDLARDRETPFRVVTRDGVSLMVTFDFVRGRINADVVDGVVVAYVVGRQGYPRREDSELTSPIWLSSTGLETTLRREFTTV